MTPERIAAMEAAAAEEADAVLEAMLESMLDPVAGAGRRSTRPSRRSPAGASVATERQPDPSVRVRQAAAKRSATLSQLTTFQHASM